MDRNSRDRHKIETPPIDLQEVCEGAITLGFHLGLAIGCQLARENLWAHPDLLPSLQRVAMGEETVWEPGDGGVEKPRQVIRASRNAAMTAAFMYGWLSEANAGEGDGGEASGSR